MYAEVTFAGKCFLNSLRDLAVMIINFERKNVTSLTTNEQQELHAKVKICFVCKKQFEHKYTKDKNYHKVKDHCHLYS